MKVLKFGGTSVGSPSSILNVKKIVEAQSEPVVVVVSALGGITDKLISTSRLAVEGDAKYLDSYSEMVSRHHEMVDSIITDSTTKTQLLQKIDPMLDDLKSIYQGVFLIHDLSTKTMNAIVSYGERISSNIVAALIKDAELKNSLDFIKTEYKHDANSLNTALTNSLVVEAFSNDFKVCVVPGFISSDTQTNEITNLGRGGSDYTASIIAATHSNLS